MAVVVQCDACISQRVAGIMDFSTRCNSVAVRCVDATSDQVKSASDVAGKLMGGDVKLVVLWN